MSKESENSADRRLNGVSIDPPDGSSPNGYRSIIREEEVKSLVNLRITHRTASIPILDAVNFKDPQTALGEVESLSNVEECALIQTCNRVEIYASVSTPEARPLAATIAEYWRGKVGFSPEEFYHHLKVATGSDVILHLMRLTSGLDSMVVGEDQIIGQVKDAYTEAYRYGTVGPVLKKVFERAIKLGRTVRVKTGINKGSVSLGSVAVNLLEEMVGNLEGKKVLLVGAGEINALVGKALAVRGSSLIFIANRTYDRAVSLSRILNAEAVKFDRLKELLTSVDMAVVATSAPHYILTYDSVSEAVKQRRGDRLRIIDLSQPRNVEERIAELPGVELRNIDNLRRVADENLKMRLREAEKAEEIILDEMMRIADMQKGEHIEPMISDTFREADDIRRRELEKAFSLMGKAHSHGDCAYCREVMNDFSHVLVRRVISNVVTDIRRPKVVDYNPRPIQD